MKDAILSSTSPVTDPRVAAVFADPLRRRLVLLLAAKKRSISELATDTGLDLKRLHYHVTALRNLGLVIVKENRVRAGRSIKVYGALASAFMVPASVSMGEPNVALMAELRKSLAHDHARRDATVYFLSASGEPRMRAVRLKGPPSAGAAEHWRVMKLSPADLLNLTTTIANYLNSLPQREGGDQAYLVHFAIAPRAGNW